MAIIHSVSQIWPPDLKSGWTVTGGIKQMFELALPIAELISYIRHMDHYVGFQYVFHAATVTTWS